MGIVALRIRKTLQYAVFVVLATFLAITISLLVLQKPSDAAPVVGFTPGNIISENIFTNNQSMTPSQIQAFLNSKVSSCDTYGAGQSEMNNSGVPDYNNNGSIQRWEWGQAKHGQTTFTCIKDFAEGGKSAAQIIYDVSQTFQINPQVLIVLLQKEQGLITDTWPLSVQYRTATGYGCPDTAPCDSQYYGLTNQLTWSAKMFRAIMNDSPTWYTPYELGNNFIQYNPNSSCGGSVVYIQNRSTQALYNYTPYQPNQSALNAGYGTGDSCGAYGNRNFFLYFSDWFGSPQFGNLVRTVDNSTVYLVSGSNKYPIADINILGALAPLGGVSYSTQAYLDSKTTGALMGRVFRTASGTVYFYDAGIKLGFTSCGQVSDYGSSCGAAILLDDYQANSFVTGPNMTSLFGTPTGKKFYITGGTKKEVFDSTSQSDAGITGGVNVLNEAAIGNLTYAAPVLRNDVIVKDRNSNAAYIYSNSTLIPLDQDLLQATYLRNVANNKLDTESINTLTKVANSNGYLRAADGSSFVFVDAGKIRLSTPSDWSVSYTQVSDNFLSLIPTTSTAAAPYTVKGTNSATIYLLTSATKRPMSSWNDLLLMASSLNILSVPDSYVNRITTGDVVLSPGSLVKTADNATVYAIDGLNKKVPLNSFSPATELGFNNLNVVPSDVLGRYTTTGSTLTPMVACGARKGIGINGKVYDLTLSYATYITLSDVTCRKTTWATTPGFLLAPNGTIYQLVDSQKRPITSYATFLSLGGASGTMVSASNYALSFIETGAPL